MDINLMHENEKLRRENEALKNGDSPKRRKDDNFIYSWLPKIAEVIIVLAIMWGGFRVSISNQTADIDNLKRIVGTSNAQKNLCERTTTIETQYTFLIDNITEMRKDIKILLESKSSTFSKK